MGAAHSPWVCFIQANIFFFASPMYCFVQNEYPNHLPYLLSNVWMSFRQVQIVQKFHCFGGCVGGGTSGSAFIFHTELGRFRPSTWLLYLPSEKLLHWSWNWENFSICHVARCARHGAATRPGSPSSCCCYYPRSLFCSYVSCQRLVWLGGLTQWFLRIKTLPVAAPLTFMFVLIAFGSL